MATGPAPRADSRAAQRAVLAVATPPTRGAPGTGTALTGEGTTRLSGGVPPPRWLACRQFRAAVRRARARGQLRVRADPWDDSERVRWPVHFHRSAPMGTV